MSIIFGKSSTVPYQNFCIILTFFTIRFDMNRISNFYKINHIFYLIRISSIVKLTKLSKFEFEVRFLKNQKNYKNSSSPKFDIRFISNRIVKNVKILRKFGYGTVELFPQKYGPVRFGSRDKF